MSKVFKAVAIVAGTVAPFLPPPFNVIAQAVSVAATIGASLTQKKAGSRAQGSTSQILVGSNMLTPYSVGRTYVGGSMIHDVGYGGVVSDVPNPYSSTALIWSGGGPVEQIEAFQADFTTVAFSGAAALGYYAGFMWLSTQLGALPEPAALAGPHGAIPGWSSAHKLSGYAAGLLTLKFDKKGKIYASGVPQVGVILKGVKAYDPRLDSTYPGGSGSHRWDDEATWEWTENPSLHGLTYARGRYQNGKKVFGCGFRKEGIDVPAFVELANVCDANGWKVGGTIYEPGSRWDNLKRLLEVAAAEPVFVGGRLTVKFNAPKVALDTITAADLADGEYRVPAMKTWKERKNGLVPKYRSEDHKWEFVQSDLVTDGTYVIEDGEGKEEEYPLELCQQKNQAAQVTAYKLVNGREFGPIVLPCKPRLIEYKIGEALNIDVPELGLNDQLCVIIGRVVNPATGIVELTFESETTAKHPFALGQVGTAPPTPTITTGQQVDAVIDLGLRSRGTYSGAEIYYLGDVAQDQNASWEYINATPGSGHAPPTLPTTSNAYWRMWDPRLGTVAEGATRNILYRQTTDPAGSNVLQDGDIWVDISGTPMVVKIRIGASWQISSNYVTQGSHIGVENGATKNTVTYSSSAPSSPTNGDIWVDTSATPIVIKVRSGGAWLTSAPTSLAALDGTASTALGNIIDRNVLDRSEKAGLIAAVAGLETRYTAVTARAATLGISTSNAAATKTAFTNFLTGLSPPWNDDKQDSPLMTSVFGDFAFPTGWTFNLVNLSQSGIYWVATDGDGSGFQFIHRAQAATGGLTYTAKAVFKKDATGAATRAPGIMLQSSGGTYTYGLITIDSATGEIKRTEGALADYRCVAQNDSEWLVSASITLAANNTGVDFAVYPAAGVNSSQSAAATGSVSIRDPALAQGGFDALGRDALEYRLRAYSLELDALDKAISERDGTTSLQIDGPKSVNVAATSSGDASGSLPLDVSYSAKIGLGSVTTAAAWTVTVLSAAGSITCTIGAATGVLNVTALATLEARVRIDCTYAGVTQSQTVTFNRVDATAPAGGGGTPGPSCTVSSFATVNSTSWTAIASCTITAASAAPSLDASGLACTPSGATGSTGTWNVESKWSRENGVTDVDIGSTVNSNPDPAVVTNGEGFNEKQSGSITCTATDSGRTVGVAYTYYLMVKLTSGSRVIAFTGEAIVSS